MYYYESYIKDKALEKDDENAKKRVKYFENANIKAIIDEFPCYDTNIDLLGDDFMVSVNTRTYTKKDLLVSKNYNNEINIKSLMEEKSKLLLLYKNLNEIYIKGFNSTNYLNRLREYEERLGQLESEITLLIKKKKIKEEEKFNISNQNIAQSNRFHAWMAIDKIRNLIFVFVILFVVVGIISSFIDGGIGGGLLAVIASLFLLFVFSPVILAVDKILEWIQRLFQ